MILRRIPMGDRLAAGHQTLDLGTMVRIHVPQPNIIFTTEGGLGGMDCWVSVTVEEIKSNSFQIQLEVPPPFHDEFETRN